MTAAPRAGAAHRRVDPARRRLGTVTRAAALVAAMVTALAACGGGGDPAPMLRVDGSGNSTIDAPALAAVLAGYPVAALSTAEAASLAFMRQEEQLAHDVYAPSAALWATPVFANITASEATHSAAVKALIDRYALADPLAGRPDGNYPDAAFQSLHDSLAAASRRSLVDALKVGVEIEELDIHDITVQKPGIDNADILAVYDNLLRGSRNHLRAYMKVLVQQGGSYVPSHLGQAEFDAIVNSPTDTGG